MQRLATRPNKEGGTPKINKRNKQKNPSHKKQQQQNAGIKYQANAMPEVNTGMREDHIEGTSSKCAYVGCSIHTCGKRSAAQRRASAGYWLLWPHKDIRQPHCCHGCSLPGKNWPQRRCIRQICSCRQICAQQQFAAKTDFMNTKRCFCVILARIKIDTHHQASSPITSSSALCSNSKYRVPRTNPCGTPRGDAPECISLFFQLSRKNLHRDFPLL